MKYYVFTQGQGLGTIKLSGTALSDVIRPDQLDMFTEITPRAYYTLKVKEKYAHTILTTKVLAHVTKHKALLLRDAIKG